VGSAWVANMAVSSANVPITVSIDSAIAVDRIVRSKLKYCYTGHSAEA